MRVARPLRSAPRMRLASFVFLLAVAGCAPTISTTYPVGQVEVTSADVSGHVVVTEPDWFTTSLPAQPRVGARVMSFPGIDGSMQMKQLLATTPREYAEVNYCESAVPIRDVEAMLRDVRTSVVQSDGVRVVGDDRIERGAWKGVSLHLMIEPHSELNSSIYAMDFRELVFVRDRRIVLVLAAVQQGDTRGAADVLRIVDGFRVAG